MTTALMDPPAAIPQDDGTRRELLIAAGALAIGLAGCGGDDGASAGPTNRTIKHFAGTTQVPVDPKRIVTLQDQNALLPLLELGVRPVASAGLLGDDGSKSFRRTDGFDTTGIAFVGEYGEPDLEAIAAARPDLIIGDEFSAEDVYPQLSKIAPTVFVQVFGRPLTDALTQFAAVVGADDRASDLHAVYQGRIKRLRSALGDDLDRTTVSLLSAGDPGSFYQADTGGQAQFTVMRDLALPRPNPQSGDGADTEYSLERLRDHDADAVIVNDFGGDGADPGVTTLVRSRLYKNLAATKAGQSYVIDASRSVGSAWARMGVFIDELERILLAPDFDHDVVDEAA